MFSPFRWKKELKKKKVTKIRRKKRENETGDEMPKGKQIFKGKGKRENTSLYEL